MKDQLLLPMFTKKSFIFFTLVYFALFGISGYFMYQENKKNIVKLIDSKLINAANTVPYLLEDYHNKNLSAQSLTKVEDLKNIKKLSAYVNQTDLAYIYSFIIDKKGQVRFASSSATQADIDANKSDIYSFDIYNDPNVIKAMQTKKPVFETTKDKWGEFHSVYIPKVSKDGRVYVVGADYELKDVENISNMLLKNSEIVFSLLLAIALLYFVLVYYMARYFNRAVDKKEKELEAVYERDALTKLYNRTKLLHDLKHYPSAELIILDIDGFKSINSVYGISFGDRCLVFVANKLLDMCDNKSFVYKLESDRFCILCPECKHEDMIRKLDKVLKILEAEKCVINGYGVYLNFFAGLSSELVGDNKLLAAEIALKEAKESREKIVIYSKELSRKYNESGKRDVIDEIHHAIAHDGIKAYFQPICNAQTKEIHKYEALMRLQKRDGSIVAPYYFMQVAQEAQLYAKIASIMFEKIIEKAKENKSIEFSMNLSSLDIENEEIQKNIFKRIEEEGLNEQITLEVLESEAFENYDNLINFAKDAERFGIKLSMDDFGSGYSNLSNLAEVHFEYIKIDGSLVKDVLVNKNYESIIQIIVAIAKKFDSVTIAEFVENEAIAEKLVELGVHKLQGYYIGKPEADIL